MVIKFIVLGKTPEANRAGIIAITNLVDEARSLAKSLNPKDRTEIEKLCDEIDALKRELENEVSRIYKIVYVYVAIHNPCI